MCPTKMIVAFDGPPIPENAKQANIVQTIGWKPRENGKHVDEGRGGGSDAWTPNENESPQEAEAISRPSPLRRCPPPPRARRGGAPEATNLPSGVKEGSRELPVALTWSVYCRQAGGGGAVERGGSEMSGTRWPIRGGGRGAGWVGGGGKHLQAPTAEIPGPLKILKGGEPNGARPGRWRWSPRKASRRKMAAGSRPRCGGRGGGGSPTHGRGSVPTTRQRRPSVPLSAVHKKNLPASAITAVICFHSILMHSSRIT